MEQDDIRVYVTVKAVFGPDGRVVPISVRWENGKWYSVDRILDIHRAVSPRTGTGGLRYTVNIGKQQTFLFLDQDRWFVERREKTAM